MIICQCITIVLNVMCPLDQNWSAKINYNPPILEKQSEIVNPSNIHLTPTNIYDNIIFRIIGNQLRLALLCYHYNL